MTTQAVAGHPYALLADGATVEIRPTAPDDAAAVTRFHEAMSPDNLYLRFFSMSKRAGEPGALGADSPYLDAVAGREQRADIASLVPLLSPRSVAVVGAGRNETSIGRAILLNIRDAGFQGEMFAVNPYAEEIGGVPCLPSVADLPAAPDLAVVAVPAASVLKVAGECGQRGVRSLVVITAGLGVA